MWERKRKQLENLLKKTVKTVSFDDGKGLGEGGGKTRLAEKGRRNQQRVSPHHHPELAVVDLPVPVLVHRPDHLVNLLVRHLSVKTCHDEV